MLDGRSSAYWRISPTIPTIVSQGLSSCLPPNWMCLPLGSWLGDWRRAAGRPGAAPGEGADARVPPPRHPPDPGRAAQTLHYLPVVVQFRLGFLVAFAVH